VGLLIVSAAFAGCDRDARARAEAHTFLALYGATDHRASVEERERKITQMEQLSISTEAVRTARDECVGAHRTLIAAERENETASAALDKALRDLPKGESLPENETTRIRAGIDKASNSLNDARGRFDKCETQVRSLSLRFGER